jgi:hypothetical protein
LNVITRVFGFGGSGLGVAFFGATFFGAVFLGAVFLGATFFGVDFFFGTAFVFAVDFRVEVVRVVGFFAVGMTAPCSSEDTITECRYSWFDRKYIDSIELFGLIQNSPGNGSGFGLHRSDLSSGRCIPVIWNFNLTDGENGK